MATKKLIKIQFKRFWEPWGLDKFLERHPELTDTFDFQVVPDGEWPEYCFFSVFGHDRIPKGSVRIFYTGENTDPLTWKVGGKTVEWDYAFSFSRAWFAGQNHYRLPNFVVSPNHVGHSIEELLEPRTYDVRNKFCCFIHRNSVKYRENFVKHLMAYKRVDCPGASMQNMNRIIPRKDKTKFMRDYKFAVCFENSRGDGYVTEKIVDAYLAGCVPIYWGDPRVVEDFNPESFINAHDFKTLIELAHHVRHVDQNEAVYRKLRLASPFHDNELPDFARKENLLEFWKKVFNYEG